MSAILAIQTAIFALLSGDATLVGMVGGRITNTTPSTPVYPYVQMSHAHEKPFHGMGGATTALGYNDIIRVHVFSRYAGDLEALHILSRVRGLLDFQPIAVSGFSSVVCEYEMGRVLIETDINRVEIRHIPAEFRVRVRQ
jgi:hypothetical protein